jgi:hypothetical protein
VGRICETTEPPRITTDGEDDHHIYCHIPLDELRRVQPVFTELGQS